MCCVYFHRRKKDNSIFYVGMGGKKRPYSTHHRNRYWRNIVNNDNGFIVDIRFNNINRELAFYFEKKYISFFGRINYDKNGLLVNCGIGGEGSSGFKMSEDSKLKISNSTKLRFENKDYRENLIKKRTGTKHSEETKNKISLNNGAKKGKEILRKRKLFLNGLHPFCNNKGENHPMFGKSHSEQSKEKISKANKGKVAVNIKPVLKYDLKNIFIKEYKSLKDASLENNCSVTVICEVCKGNQKTAKGFIWKYK